MKKTTRRVVFTALFAAMIFVGTRLNIPAPFGSGYIHLGDSFIYICALALPFPFGIFAASIGAALADVLSGYMIYVPATVIVKSVMALCFVNKGEKLLCKPSSIGIFGAGLVNIGGYYIAECLMYGVAGAVPSILSNVVQSVGAAVLFIVLAATLDRVGFKKMFSRI